MRPDEELEPTANETSGARPLTEEPPADERLLTNGSRGELENADRSGGRAEGEGRGWGCGAAAAFPSLENADDARNR